MILAEKSIAKTKMNQFLYVPIKNKDIKVGDEVVVEIYSNNRLIRRSRYTVLEKEICKRLKFKRKCYRYKFILVQLPWFNIIRSKGGDPKDLRIIVRRADSIN